MKTFEQILNLIEDAPTVSISSGGIAGMGYGPKPSAEPGAYIKRRKKDFAGLAVFEVDANTFNRCKLGKAKYKHWRKFINESPVSDEIREYANKSRTKPILIQDPYGTMLFVRGSHLGFLNTGKF